MADKGGPANNANKQGAFKDREKPTEIRYANITAGKGTCQCAWLENMSTVTTGGLVQLLQMLFERVLVLGEWIKWLVIFSDHSICCDRHIRIDPRLQW